LPTIPEKLAVKLKQHSEWLFSTRKLRVSPYDLGHYVLERDRARGNDYAILCHSGHGVNSYAIQYYLVYGSVRIFLFLGWGGAYMNAKKATSEIRECFSLADAIVAAAMTTRKLGADKRLTVIGSDFYDSRWSAPGHNCRKKESDCDIPTAVLREALDWLKCRRPK